jgi:hypothetical protein
LKQRTHISPGALPPLLDEPSVDRVVVVVMVVITPPSSSYSRHCVGGWDAVGVCGSEVWDTGSWDPGALESIE